MPTDAGCIALLPVAAETFWMGLLLAIAGGLALSIHLQRLISGPAARAGAGRPPCTASSDGNFSVRAQKAAEDDVRYAGRWLQRHAGGTRAARSHLRMYQNDLEKRVRERTVSAGRGRGRGAGSARACRGRQPRQERVPGAHEPRDPHADERRARHGRTAAHRPRSMPGSAATPPRSTSPAARCSTSSTTSSTSPRSRPASSSCDRRPSACATSSRMRSTSWPSAPTARGWS